MSRFTSWRLAIFANLFVTYVSFYLCRSNLTVASPYLKQDGITKGMIGTMISVGTAFYVVGKSIGSPFVDFYGGRIPILVACFGSIIATLIFPIIGTHLFPLLVVAWCINRLVQSFAWPSVIKFITLWYEEGSRAKITGIMSLSYLFGDSLARLLLGSLINLGMTWEGTFYFGASVMFLVLCVSFFVLKKDPTEIGEKEVAASSANVYGDGGSRPENLKELYLPLLKSFPVYLLLILSIGLTFIRETLRDWIPIYLQETSQVSAISAIFLSAIEPAAGGISSIFLGILLDRDWGKKRRGILMSLFLFVLILSLLLLWIENSLKTRVNLWLSLTLLSLVGFSLTGPYALSGYFSTELGGKKGSATLSGLTDAVGYFGSIFSGFVTGKLAEKYGWSVVFALLTVFALISICSTIAYYIYVERSSSQRGPARHMPLSQQDTFTIDDDEELDSGIAEETIELEEQPSSKVLE